MVAGGGHSPHESMQGTSPDLESLRVDCDLRPSQAAWLCPPVGRHKRQKQTEAGTDLGREAGDGGRDPILSADAPGAVAG